MKTDGKKINKIIGEAVLISPLLVMSIFLDLWSECALIIILLFIYKSRYPLQYHALKEFCEMRGVSRYAVNHLNKMLADSSHSPIRITPTGWRNASRFDMGENDKKAYIKEFFKKWREWETQTKAFYENKFKELTDGGYIACANKINELIRDVDKELKCLEREFLTISSTGFDMLFIASRQDELHRFYEEKEKAIGVEFN